jgi:predicted nuclease with TOPRIM domain
MDVWKWISAALMAIVVLQNGIKAVQFFVNPAARKVRKIDDTAKRVEEVNGYAVEQRNAILDRIEKINNSLEIFWEKFDILSGNYVKLKEQTDRIGRELKENNLSTMRLELLNLMEHSPEEEMMIAGEFDKYCKLTDNTYIRKYYTKYVEQKHEQFK